jgi:hypothetical protein
MKDDAHYNLYVLAEIAYKKAYKDKEEHELFPADWYSISNYQAKTEIIAEALKNKILIAETNLYKSRIEGVRDE